jgi:SOS-response transcriptional repressor LexA
MNIYTRIKSRRAALKMRFKDVVVAMNGAGLEEEVAWQTVQKWEKPPALGGNVPRPAYLPSLAKALQTSVEWLLTGNDANLTLEVEYIFVRRYRRPTTGSGIVAAADHHYAVEKLDDEHDTLAVHVDFIQQKQLDPEQLRFWVVEDDAMAPKIGPGNTVLLDIRPQAIQDGGVYAFEAPGAVRFRRCFVRMDGLITLRPDNVKRPEEVGPGDRLPMVGRVVRIISDDV